MFLLSLEMRVSGVVQLYVYQYVFRKWSSLHYAYSTPSRQKQC